jgi:hypothetical protein
VELPSIAKRSAGKVSALVREEPATSYYGFARCTVFTEVKDGKRTAP